MNEDIDITIEELKRAALDASIGRARRPDVAEVLSDLDVWAKDTLDSILDGSYVESVGYTELVIVNLNGKIRNILWPNFFTLALQHLCINRLNPIYQKIDPMVGVNCKKGCGISAKEKKGSVTKRLKHIVYDRRDLNYMLIIDQRQCYDHVKPKSLRRALKELLTPRWFNDFAISLCFHKSHFPVGTPTSPLAHHILMLPTDRLIRSISPMAVRYADDIALPFATKEEAQSAKWRLKNLWWYTLDLRAKKHTLRIFPLTLAFDFCGIVFHRNPDKSVCDHNKGYTTIRANIAQRAKTANEKSYPSYFGLLKNVDGYGLMKYIESNNMNLRNLTEKIRINRNLDAPNISVKELIENDTVFTIHDYEVRADKNGDANWIKCLISFHSDKASGRRVMREFHGNYNGIISFIQGCEKEYGKDNILPLAQAKIIKSCGFIFEGSTNMIEYIDDSPEYNN